MTPAERIIRKFGSPWKLAKALGHRNPSTVQGWRDRGTIPVRHAPYIIAASASLAEPVEPVDFVPVPVASSDLPQVNTLSGA